MGSYLSIVNDTPDTWHCKVGHDEKALSIAGLAIGGIGVVAAIIATAGAAAPLSVSLLAGGSVVVTGVSTAALAGRNTAAAIGAATITPSGYTDAVVNGISTNLVSKGFHKIESGEKHSWGKMSLSLWRQGTCVRAYATDYKTVRVETLYMRPIFSGATANSDKEHSIQKWIDKNGVKAKDIVASSSNGQQQRLLQEGGQVFYLHENQAVNNTTELEDLKEGDVVYIYPKA